MKKTCLGMMLVFITVGAHAADGAIRTYCCENEEVGKICADDRLPVVCQGKAHHIIDQNGNVIKRVDAHMNEAERREWAKNAHQRKKEEDEARRRVRLDQALLDTYYSERDIDVVQKRAERTVRRNIKRATERLEKAMAKLTKAQKEAKKYPNKKEMPQNVLVQLNTAEGEVLEEQTFIESKERELKEIALRYDEDRKRFRSLIKDAQAFSKAEAAKRNAEKKE